MFTGLIQYCGNITAYRIADHGVTIQIDASGWSHQPSHGDSISVNGCCLTVRLSDNDPGVLTFDVIHETLRCTTLGQFREGQRMNLEHSVTPTTLLGGHIVQGHVDGFATVTAIDTDSGEHRVQITLPERLQSFVAPKGSIAVDGVSLTIASLHDDGIEIALIPTTLELTTLGSLTIGEAVNIEADYIAKLVVQSVQRLHKTT